LARLVWVGVAGVVGMVVIILALIFSGLMTSEKLDLMIPLSGIIVAIVVLTLIFAREED
jgi:uncharacterized membrane protein